jgi:DNA-binding response OmpR family regulator
VERRFPLEPVDRVFVGRRVGFVFVPLDSDTLERAMAELRGQRAQTASVDTRREIRPGSVRIAQIAVRAVTEGGAVAAIGEEQVQLSELEYELLCVLSRRLGDEAQLDESVRGFVPGEQLLGTLSFKSEAPSHANLRGVVRKLRRKLPDVDVVESRKGLGYRLAQPIELG